MPLTHPTLWVRYCTCTSTNTRLLYAIHAGLPGAPRAVATPVVGLFNAQLIWNVPEDDGGVSDPSWNPDIDGKQTITSLTYIVTLTNGAVERAKNLSLVLSNLQHSTTYTVTVEAENVYGRGPQGTSIFTTSKYVMQSSK